MPRNLLDLVAQKESEVAALTQRLSKERAIVDTYKELTALLRDKVDSLMEENRRRTAADS